MRVSIKRALVEALHAAHLPAVQVSLDRPQKGRGEYATGVALAVARESESTPMEIAEKLQGALQRALPEVKVEVAAPGFLNFSLPRSFFVEQVRRAGEGDLYTPSEQGERVLLEYMSPNLFKPLHVGNLVGAITGEALARIASFRGASVTRLSYPSDSGLSVAKAVWGLKHTDADPHSVGALGEAYRYAHEAYETSEEARAEMVEVNRALYEESDKELLALKEVGLQTSLRHVEEIAALLGIVFDDVVFESTAAVEGKRIVEEHLSEGIFEKDDGAVIVRGERYGLHTRVFLNAQGFPTYEAKELGNFYEKQRRFPDWDTMLVITGSEQKEYFTVLHQVIREVFSLPEEKQFSHISTGFLTLTEGKMSTRKGKVLTGESVLNSLKEEALKRAEHMRTTEKEELAVHIALAALKYRILRQKTGNTIVFSAAQALSFEGDSGPYLQYTYARLCSILQRAEERGLRGSVENPFTETVAVEKLLHQFAEVVDTSFSDRSPHHLVSYLILLSSTFNTFYAKERILRDADEYTPYRLAIVQAVQEILKKGLWLLAIPSPTEF